MPQQIDRRTFLSTTTTSATALAVSPSILADEIRGGNDRLNIAFIGMGSRVHGHVGMAIRHKHNVVAFCDVDRNQIAESKKRHGDPVAKAAEYEDYRVLLEKEKSLDAVVISTPDHWHAPICTAAIETGRHVYCEKPLTHTIAEARALRELSRRSKVVTQTGNQGSASPNLRRSIELVQAGLFGHISSIHIWHPKHGWPCGVSRPTVADPVPDGLNWDFWCGPAPLRHYNNGIYHPAKWRGWYDFGNGSIGDFCCHSFNMPVRALKLEYPTRIAVSGQGLGLESYPTSCTTTFRFPATADRGTVDMIYYTGGDMPPTEITDQLVGTFGSIPRVGCVLVGEKGLLSAGLWNSQCYVKLNGEEKFWGHGNHPEAKKIPETIPRSPGHVEEWFDAIRNGTKTYSDFDFGGRLTEIGLAGNVAMRLQRDIDWDGPNMKAVGVPEADAYVRTQHRTKWL